MTHLRKNLENVKLFLTSIYFFKVGLFPTVQEYGAISNIKDLTSFQKYLTFSPYILPLVSDTKIIFALFVHALKILDFESL